MQKYETEVEIQPKNPGVNRDCSAYPFNHEWIFLSCFQCYSWTKTDKVKSIHRTVVRKKGGSKKTLTILHSKTLEKFFSKIKKINKSGSREKKEIMATVLWYKQGSPKEQWTTVFYTSSANKKMPTSFTVEHFVRYIWKDNSHWDRLSRALSELTQNH